MSFGFGTCWRRHHRVASSSLVGISPTPFTDQVSSGAVGSTPAARAAPRSSAATMATSIGTARCIASAAIVAICSPVLMGGQVPEVRPTFPVYVWMPAFEVLRQHPTGLPDHVQIVEDRLGEYAIV